MTGLNTDVVGLCLLFCCVSLVTNGVVWLRQDTAFNYIFPGVSAMNTFEKDSVRKMRENGKSYSQIAAALSISENTVKSFCRRMGIISLVGKPVCPVCGKILIPSKQGQRRRFCSDTCRFVWNYGHRVLDAHNAIACRCAHCQREFFSYPSAHRKYCSHDCYIADRYGKEALSLAAKQS